MCWIFGTQDLTFDNHGGFLVESLVRFYLNMVACDIRINAINEYISFVFLRQGWIQYGLSAE